MQKLIVSNSWNTVVDLEGRPLRRRSVVARISTRGMDDSNLDGREKNVKYCIEGYVGINGETDDCRSIYLYSLTTTFDYSRAWIVSVGTLQGLALVHILQELLYFSPGLTRTSDSV